LSATNDAGVKRYALPGVPNPVLPADIANKAYVDSLDFLTRVKAVTETKNNDAVLADDAELVIPLEANSVYKGELFILMSSGAVPDFQYEIAIPAGASGSKTSDNLTSNVGGFTLMEAVETVVTMATGGFLQGLVILFTVATVAAGSVAFRWAQNNSNAGDTNVFLGSSMIMRKSQV